MILASYYFFFISAVLVVFGSQVPNNDNNNDYFSTIILSTRIEGQELIGVKVHSGSVDAVLEHFSGALPINQRSSLNSFVEYVSSNFPEATFEYDCAVCQRIKQTKCRSHFDFSKQVGWSFNESEDRELVNLEDWKASATLYNFERLKISIQLENFFDDGVSAYKALKATTDPKHLIHRNLEVTFLGVENRRDIETTRNCFLDLFMQIVKDSNAYFVKNAEGLYEISDSVSNTSHLEAFEAIGFYLGKLFQNELSASFKFSKIILKMIKVGDIHEDYHEYFDEESKYLRCKSSLFMLSHGFRTACPANLIAGVSIDHLASAL